MRLIDANDFGNRMYHEAFVKDTDMQKWDSGCWIRYKLFENVLREQPTIEPQRWIPCTERLPNNDDWVIVTIRDERGDTPWTYSDFGWYLEAAKCWIVDAEQRTDIVAWMPLPNAYTK